MAKTPGKKAARKPKSGGDGAQEKPDREVMAEVAVLGADWVATVREVLHDVQVLALERTTYQYHPSQDEQTQSYGQDQNQHLHVASLAPALRRLRRVFKEEVGFGADLVEENWVLFRDELWLAIRRVLVASKVSVAVVYAFGAFFGEFLCSFAPREGKDRQNKKDTPNTKKKREQESSLNELRIEILNRLMEVTKAEDKNVRIRVCHFLQIILNKLDYIEEDLLTKLRAVLIPRANDKVSSVRVQTAYALKRVQEPDDPKDKVTAELLRIMVSDPSKDVRKAAVHSIAATKASYPDLLIRIRDTSEEVRHAVFKVFGDQMSVRDIPISDRAHLLDQGLQDRSEMVRAACEEMVLKKWLPACRGSPITLLKALDIEQFPVIGTKVSTIILRHVSENPSLQDVIPHNALEILAQNSEACDAESIFFWREQCHYYQKIDRDHDKVAALLPNISDFCKLVVVACEAGAEMLFIAQQLLALGHLLDFQDEFGRRKLLDCLQKMLRNIETETQLISSIMELMACIHSGNSDQEFIQVVAEITSDLYDPLEENAEEKNDEDKSEEEKPPKLNEKNNLSQEELDAATHRFEELESRLDTLDFDSAEYIEVQNEMLELEKLLQDPEVLRRLRCLEIVAQLLKLTGSTLRDPTIAGMGRYILPAIESEVPAVREAGMECLGLFCLLDKQVAERQLIVFWRALNNEEEERDVKLNCLKAIFDMLFSFANLQPKVVVPKKPENEEGMEDGDEPPTEVSMELLPLDSVLLGLAQLLHVEDLDVQSTIVEGFGKLFLLNRIKNVAVLGLLLETYFSPHLQHVQLMSEHGFQSRSLQLLSIFFPAFVRSSTLNCSLMEEASIHLVQKWMEKEEFGDSNTIDLAACLKYAFHLLSHFERSDENGKLKSEGKESKQKAPCAHHNRIGLNICMDILALEHLVSSEAEGIDQELIVNRQKVLVKAVVLSEISPVEQRSAALFQSLLADVTSKCFASQRGLVRSAELFYKRTMTSYKERGGEANDDVTILEQDQEWAQQRILERAQALQVALAEATKKEEQRRRQKKRQAAKKRRAGRFSSSESDDSDEDDEEGSDIDGKEKAAPVRREVSTRKSKSIAVDRITNRDFDVKMKIAFESDEDDEEEEESEEESDEESSAEEDD
ncbi:Condensin complex subunit 3, partial [Globisporangium splendens]